MQMFKFHTIFAHKVHYSLSGYKISYIKYKNCILILHDLKVLCICTA